MPRVRVLLAILFAVTWCSAAWHVDLEAVGLMLDHQHHAHEGHDHDHSAGVVGDDHEPLFARDMAKDTQVRVGATGVLWFTVVGIFAALGMAFRPRLAEIATARKRRRSDPPLAQVWHFVWRCAPESAAPPALG
jgi:hypothetical protein